MKMNKFTFFQQELK